MLCILLVYIHTSAVILGKVQLKECYFRNDTVRDLHTQYLVFFFFTLRRCRHLTMRCRQYDVSVCDEL